MHPLRFFNRTSTNSVLGGPSVSVEALLTSAGFFAKLAQASVWYAVEMSAGAPFTGQKHSLRGS
jgi:hypothetical protein